MLTQKIKKKFGKRLNDKERDFNFYFIYVRWSVKGLYTVKYKYEKIW